MAHLGALQPQAAPAALAPGMSPLEAAQAALAAGGLSGVGGPAVSGPASADQMASFAVPGESPLAAAQRALQASGLAPAAPEMGPPAGPPPMGPAQGDGYRPGAIVGNNNLGPGGIVLPPEEEQEEGIITKMLTVPVFAIGLIIGRSGENIRNLQIQAGADIQVTREFGAQGGDTRTVTIMGPPENCEHAESLIMAIVAEKESDGGPGGVDPGTGLQTQGPPGISMGGMGGRVMGGGGMGGSPRSHDHNHGADAIKVDIKHVGLIIGRGGETIKSMQAESGANIQVGKDADPGDPPNMRTISFLGDPMSAGKAKEMVEDLINKDRRYGGDGGMPGGFQQTGMPGGMQGNEGETMDVPNTCVGGIIGRAGATIQMMQQQVKACPP